MAYGYKAMPEIIHRKIKPTKESSRTPPALQRYEYAELQITTNFSFLRGASHPEEFVWRAVELGYRGIGIADANSLAGVVRGHIAAKEHHLPYLVGSRLEIGTKNATITALAYPLNREGYGNLCRLLTLGKRRSSSDETILELEDLSSYQRSIAFILVPSHITHDFTDSSLSEFLESASSIRDITTERHLLSLALSHTYTHDAHRRIQRIHEASRELGIPLVVTNDAYYHSPGRRELQDVLTCIRNGCTIQQAGFLLFQNSERHLKPPEEMYRLFFDHQNALRRTLEIAEAASLFSLDELRYEYPIEICPEGLTPLEYLTSLVKEGLEERFSGSIPDKVTNLVEDELKLIAELQYEKYFLTCYDIVRYARSQEILCQGRGAAANSVVCYALGITSVDPMQVEMLFARFVSKERNEPPDIDIDFEHERREEVIQYIYKKYGREYAGLTAEVVTFRHRSAIREVGKAMGLSLQVVDRLAKAIHRWTGAVIPEESIQELGIDTSSHLIQKTFLLSKSIIGFPRHLSQHVGGFIICRSPLCESVPIRNAAMPDRTIIEWDKDDIEELGMLKIDVLGLGMLTCVRKALALVNEGRKTEGITPYEMYSIPREDPDVYDMICKADTLGVFQIESRAQMSMLPRLKPRCFYDLVIEVAIVRPGPIQGKMVHPYLKRRSGLEKAEHPDPRVEQILGKTLGVPLFQEQAMRLAITLANFTPGEAEQLRRAMAAWKRNEGVIAAFKERIIAGMKANGYSDEFAETCVTQIKGFSEYGFPESHAASFALIVYASAWLKCHHPAEFATALLNSQPMGFYAPSQIISDAQVHGVKVHPIDIKRSQWDHIIESREGKGEIRLGYRLIKGMRESQAILLWKLMSDASITSLSQLWRASRELEGERLMKATLYTCAKADAFSSFGLTRRDALWAIQALQDEPLPFVSFEAVDEEKVKLPSVSRQQEMFEDYSATGISLKAHPLSFLRQDLIARSVSTCAELRQVPLLTKRGHKVRVGVAGIAIIKQRPGTANGMVFVTIEDETGIANLMVRAQLFTRYQKEVVMSACLLARGILERIGENVYINVESIESIDYSVVGQRDSGLPTKSYSY